MSDIATSAIVDGTLDALIIASVTTWGLISIKGIQLIKISHKNKNFREQFWSASSLQNAEEYVNSDSPAARLIGIGFETLKSKDLDTSIVNLEQTWDKQELLDRRLHQQIQKERGSLENGLAVLATIGSISPFVGLFGTVWGIMGALTNISKTGSASLEIVAGPIGEALIATAVGIAVAVPAVVAYNFFIRRNKVLLAFLEDFAIDFLHLSLKTSISHKNANSDSVN